MRTHRRARSLWAGVAAGLLALTACSDPDAAVPEPAEVRTEVEVFTWWASGSEKLGLDALVAVFAEQHPDVTFVDATVAGGAGSTAKDVLGTRLAQDDPPDTFQAHAGAELADYVGDGQLQDLSGLYDDLGLREALPPGLVDRLTVDSGIYAVPSNIHRANMVWANPAVLEDAGLDPQTRYASLEEWFTALDAVQASGRTPLALATTWTQVHLLETVLLAELGPQAYSGLWDGSTDWQGTEVTAALESFDHLLSYTNGDRDRLDWPDATDQVITGAAGFTVMGDWALAAFEAAQSEYLAFPVPGTDGVFDFLADSFTVPDGADSPDGARAWLETVASLEGQTAFSRAKGSIPARTDVDPADLDEYQRDAMEAFAQDTIVPSLAHGAAVPTATLDAISAATSTFAAGSTDVTGFQADLAAAVAG